MSPLPAIALPLLNLLSLRASPAVTRTGSIWGSGPSTTLSYFYPVPPSGPVSTAFSTGSWPRDRAAVPKTIYECDPPPSRGLEPRSYTCWNEDIDLGPGAVVVPGAEVQELDGGEAERMALISLAAGFGGGIGEGAPERIREWQLKRIEESPRCDGRTGLATEVLHWGAWQHSCFEGDSEWAVQGREVRKEVLRDRAEQDYGINARIREMWEVKNEELKAIEVERWKYNDGEVVKVMREREERFWSESFVVREEGRRLDERIGEEFERRVKAVSFFESTEFVKKNGRDNGKPKEPEKPKPKEPDQPKPMEPEPRPRILEHGTDVRAKKLKVKVKEKGGRMKVKVKGKGVEWEDWEVVRDDGKPQDDKPKDDKPTDSKPKDAKAA